MFCPACGYNPIRRVARVGFLQKNVYPLFGYFPWICSACKKTFILHKRRERKRRAIPVD